MRMQVIGSNGVAYDVMGPSRKRRGGRRAEVQVRKAQWRERQLAPGVQLPDEGLYPLGLNAPNNNTFDVNNASLIFEGRIQKPFRGERILVDTVRTGATAVGRLLARPFVGTDLQLVDIRPVDIEQIGTSQAFGVRLTMVPAQPGVTIALDVTLSQPVTGVDTIFTTMQLLGRVEA